MPRASTQTAPLRAGIYLRQSLDAEGTGDAVARQESACRALADARGWDVVEVYTDNDTTASGRKPRPAYAAIIAAARAGDLDVIVAWHLDRLTRSVRDLEDLVDLSDDHSFTIATVSGDLDLTNATGRLVARMLGSVARSEIERKGERHRAAARQLAERGLPMPGVRAFGYGPDNVTPDPVEAPLVVEAYERVLAGGSLASIARDWNAAGHRTSRGSTWATNSVRGVLASPRYKGVRGLSREVKGTTVDERGRKRVRRVIDEVGPAVWPALVDAATWEGVRVVLSDPGRRTATTSSRRHLGAGLYLCDACGRPVRSGYRSTGVRTYACLRNLGGCGMTRGADPVDDYVADVVVARLTAPDAAVDVDAVDVARAADDVDTLTERLREVGRLLAAGDLDPVAAAAASRELRVALDDARRRASRTPTVEPLPVVTGRAAFDALPLDARRRVVAALVDVRLARGVPGAHFVPDTVVIRWAS